MARPSKLNDELLTRICGHLEKGLPRRRAAALEGIDESTFTRWFYKGANVDEKGLARKFFIEVNRAEAQLQKTCIEMLQSGMKAGDPRVVLNFLGRRFADEWGRKDNVEEARPEDQAANAQVMREQILERFERLCPDATEPAAEPAPVEPPDAQ
jgi:hypothetical protein